VPTPTRRSGPADSAHAFAVVALVSLLVLAAGVVHAARVGRATPTGLHVNVTVSAVAYGSPMPAGFLGLSLEYWSIESYAGHDATALDPVFVRLVRNLVPGQHPVLRIGGDSADWTWWPVPGLARPPGVTFALTANWLQTTRALTRSLDARLILGLNLEADLPALAAGEARALLTGLDPGRVEAFELGNEPSLYGIFPWYRTHGGRGVPGRPAGYGFTDFVHDFTTVAAQLPAHALAGPSIGGPGWIPDLDRFLAAAPAVRLVTVHRYPLQLCVTSRRSSRYPTIAHLLAETATSGLAALFLPAVAAAHSRGLPLRIDELNTVACGADPAVSQTFASALWAIDALFELKRIGVDGVQIHTFPGAGYDLFGLRRSAAGWTASVAPEYYGLLGFAAAAPPGSRLLSVAGDGGGTVKAWATRGRDRLLRVIVIDKDPRQAATVQLRLPATARGRLVRLEARSASARTGVTFGGQGFGATTSTGRLGPPRWTSVGRTDGAYVVSVAPATAALLVVPVSPANRSGFSHR
jgi:hypothetical protein